jgi:transcriptional regulator with XRE-family HTH domain
MSRAGRALLDWSLRDLATATGLNFTTVARFERTGRARKETLRRISEGLSQNGIELLSSERLQGVMVISPESAQ